ncbi:putative bifunctional inhibitor/plant lipid transfer protein/seed storage helical domain superfamily [Helianthus annuus]|uniref:Bifunctional inhibitor/plant lipid transfer protein/seed storage helical domain superfamily n=1 Tax=Helianthus annuus TaxID=4232 RepID=A0A161BZ66_HELAN|nr:seed storage albumin 12 precursor [Helianthus annuus]KAF5773878.1 putative bifunctional inhibitor/plant lipid transfer protein/seed storage helical domain superfamily [Helianthus annuus]KAJ0481728.1 putative bifunctional inhibitor/plant lipid transfer protein/seed storage helical domain superfamily [Helianthus annuus]KAJ0849689.1 putative bifunctional inhibitor/plant lipid transfer protein/seed storage helical domain superfamily [Helianthus annuus]
MDKLALFAFTLTTIVTFYDVSATIIENTIKDNGLRMHMDNPRSSQIDCPKANDNDACYVYLADAVSSHQQKMGNQQRLRVCCCIVLKNVTKQRQCNDIQQAYNKALPKAKKVLDQMLVSILAERLPKDCELEVKECQIVKPKG